MPRHTRSVAIGLAGLLTIGAALATGPAAIGDTAASDTPRHLLTGSVESGNSTLGIVVHPTNGLIYVANSRDNTVSVIDPTTLTKITDIPVSDRPESLDIDETTGNIWVQAKLGPMIDVIDSATNQVITSIPLPFPIYPNIIDVNSTTGLAYAHNIDGSTVGGTRTVTLTVIDTKTYAVVDTIAVSSERPVNEDGTTGYDIVVDEARNVVHVADYGTNRVTTIDGRDSSIVRTLAIDKPTSLAMNRETGALYVASYSNKSIVAINPTTGEELARFSDKIPVRLTMDDESGLLYVPQRSAAEGDDLVVLDAVTLAPVDRVPLDSSPYETAVDPQTQQVFTTTIRSTAVSVITRYHQRR